METFLENVHKTRGISNNLLEQFMDIFPKKYSQDLKKKTVWQIW